MNSFSSEPQHASPPATCSDCSLCQTVGGTLVVQRDNWRVVRVSDVSLPAYYRLIWTPHVTEMTDLTAADQMMCWQVLSQIENLMRQHLNADKINWALFGNMTPHLHWHIMARYSWDAYFPQPAWGTRQREDDLERLKVLNQQLNMLDQAIETSL